MAVRTGLKKRQRIETGGKELGIASKTDGAGKEVYNSLIKVSGKEVGFFFKLKDPKRNNFLVTFLVIF